MFIKRTIGAALAAVVLSANPGLVDAQEITRLPLPQSAVTVPEWHSSPFEQWQDGEEFTPPPTGRLAQDWVFGPRFDLDEPVVWNSAKQKMIDGADLVGTTINTYDEELYCEMADAGYDFTWVEMQHAPIDQWQMAAMYNACRDSEAVHGVRIAETSEHQIQRVLDSGAMVVMVPTVNSYEQALEIVQWAYFPPMGRRSAGGGQAFQMYSGVPGGYRASFNDNLVLVLMIETLWGVEDVDKIVNIPGVDAVFAAAGDLGNFSGYAEGDAPYEYLIARVHDAAVNAGIRLCGPMRWHEARSDRENYTCFQAGRNPDSDLRERQ